MLKKKKEKKKRGEGGGIAWASLFRIAIRDMGNGRVDCLGLLFQGDNPGEMGERVGFGVGGEGGPF